MYSANNDGSEEQPGKLLKVPNGREDVFQDQVLDFKAKRALMKFLRFIGEYEEQQEVWESHRTSSFPTFLSKQFKVPGSLLAPLLALTLSSSTPDQITTEYALPRVARHLRSIGVFGAGFGAVIPKWGGMSEVAQVGCRACAVGGGIYVLGKGLESSSPEENVSTDGSIKIQLQGGDSVTAKYVVESSSQKPTQSSSLWRSIAIVSSPLQPLFPPIAEDAPSPASAVVVFPSDSLSLENDNGGSELQGHPVQIFVHSSDTGECPSGQSVLYVSTALPSPNGPRLLQAAVSALVSAVDVTPRPSILYSIQYEQSASSPPSALSPLQNERVLSFPASGLDLAFDDEIIDGVKDVWRRIVGDGEDAGEFLVFEDRESYDDE